MKLFRPFILIFSSKKLSWERILKEKSFLCHWTKENKKKDFPITANIFSIMIRGMLKDVKKLGLEKKKNPFEIGKRNPSHMPDRRSAPAIVNWSVKIPHVRPQTNPMAPGGYQRTSITWYFSQRGGFSKSFKMENIYQDTQQPAKKKNRLFPML